MIRSLLLLTFILCTPLTATEISYSLDGAKEMPEIIEDITLELQDTPQLQDKESYLAKPVDDSSAQQEPLEETDISDTLSLELPEQEGSDSDSISEEETEEEQLRVITITNAITQESLPYKHWTGTHTPKEFIFSANDEEIEQGESKKIEIINNIVYLRYDYDFGYDMAICRGAYETEYIVDEDQEQFVATFSWNEKFRIIMPGATPVAEEKMEFGE